MLTRVTGASGAIICLEEPRPPFHSLFQKGIQTDSLSLIKRICIEQFQQIPTREDSLPIIVPLAPQQAAHLVLFSLGRQRKPLGSFGLVLPVPDQLPRQIFLEKLTVLLTYFVGQFLDRLGYDKKIAHLNTYLAVSSKIAQTLNLRELSMLFCTPVSPRLAPKQPRCCSLMRRKRTFDFTGWKDLPSQA